MPTPRVSTRIRRTSHRQGPRAPLWLVERMQVAAIGMVNAYTDRLMRALGPLLEHRYGQQPEPAPPRQDAAQHQDAASVHPGTPDLDDVFRQVQEGELSRPFLERMFHLVDNQAADDLQRVVPVALGEVLPRATQMREAWIEKNTGLIRLEERARKEVAAIVNAPIAEGIRVEEIRARIQERMGVVRSRAELIARDQTLKLYGNVQEQRQTEAGIVEYTWSGSLDERERPEHLLLEGTTQRWDSPPIVDRRTGRREHPGGDFQCRCCAIPVLPSDEAPISETRPSVRVPTSPLSPEEEAFAGPLPPDPVEIERQRLAEERAARAAERERVAAERAAAEAERQRRAAEQAAAEAERERQRAETAAARLAEARRPTPGPPSGPPGSGPPPSRDALLTTHEAYAEHLATRGVRVDEETFHNARRLMGDVSARELDAIVGWDALGEIAGERSAHMSAGFGRVQFGVIIERPDRAVQLTRSFRKEAGKLLVHHDLLWLPEALQGKGIGPRLIAAQVTAYERMGVASIDLDAAWIGRYYWPKLGFTCPPAALKRYSAAFVVFLQGEGFDAQAVSDIMKGIKTIRGIAVSQVGKRQVGKEFLLSHERIIPGLKMSLKPGSRQLAIMKREIGL